MDADPDANCCRRAEKYIFKRLDTVAKNIWLEMGVVAITVVIRTTPDGHIGVEMYVHKLNMSIVLTKIKH
jgi:hypothetical protein